jgi:hypothetical protein
MNSIGTTIAESLLLPIGQMSQSWSGSGAGECEQVPIRKNAYTRVDVNLTRLLYCLSLVCTLLLAACGKPSANEVRLLSPVDGKIQVIDLPADRRAAWVIQNPQPTNERPSPYFVCAEPPTDAGLSIQQAGKTSGKHVSGTELSGEYARQIGISELSGRTPAVLALRDVMYRMCEARLQGAKFEKDSPETRIYEGVVDAINRFARSEQISADAARERAIAATSSEDPRRASAKAKERDGIEALGKFKLDEAKNHFVACEEELPGFRACQQR